MKKTVRSLLRYDPKSGRLDALNSSEAYLSKGERTRQRIVEQVMPLFNQHGFDGTSLQQMMQATSLEKGGIYRHFASKEEIAVEALKLALTLARKTRTEHLGAIDGALPKLHRSIQDFIEVPSPIPGGCPMMNAAIDCDDGNPVLRDIVRDAFRRWRLRLTAILREGQKRDEILATAVPRQIANTMIAVLEGALVLSRLEGNKQPLRDAQASLHVLLESIAAGR